MDVCFCFPFLQRHRQDRYNGYYIDQTSSSRYYRSGSYNPTFQRIPQRRRILFYHKHRPYYGFTNFSPHKITYEGKIYPTSEHLFQAMKVWQIPSYSIFWRSLHCNQFLDHKPLLAEHIRTCSKRPSDAFSEAHRFQSEMRCDWQYVRISKVSFPITLCHPVWLGNKDGRDPPLKIRPTRVPKTRTIGYGWRRVSWGKPDHIPIVASLTHSRVKDSDKDSFWGIGADKKGRNELGQALMRLRENLRAYRRWSQSIAMMTLKYGILL